MITEKICPYPGLRPFNEEESIFFRGREEHIEKIISQLEEKKFVMLTGASGDGKSSIVYAGVIPNARAGFFKAKFNSWQIADFRPERTPLKNMAIALADKLGYEDAVYVEKELGFGFSSLINLYKNSKYYLDQNSEAWHNVDDTEKKKLKRKAANLFILVDQFEEFFTNTENYHNGKASVQSQTVINLLLETAKIALAQDLPIYIICTMRSDYIGQCAAFRGLPEYIGFSQFFVPRLKRKEIHQVIEEPATLSGNTISNRLTETLINELGEGFDQLPVLQHALNQVWTQADKGNEEMDLIHLAKLSGLPENSLPVDDKGNFKSWFTTVPEFKRGFFENPSLENVLNSHANELYNTAFEYYNSHQKNEITKEDACAIIKAAFQCLTKIDDSRAVRNRMTLEEITNVINRPEITTEIVGGILDLFRLQGNTFLKPFVTSDHSTAVLKPSDVIDITHESLIRNWDLLTEWAKEEYENWVNFLDFNKQLQRWLSNNKAKGYLLPIGPLTFFEGWYNNCKPNKYWLARYDDSETPWDEKLANAELMLQNAQLFIKKSSDKLFFSRFVLKHGARKLTIGLIYMIFLPLCIHYYLDYTRKQNKNVVEDLEQRGWDMLSSVKISNINKAKFIINYERLSRGSMTEALNSVDNDTLAFDLAKEMFGLVQNFETLKETKDEINPLVYPLLTYMDQRLDNLLNRQRLAFKTTYEYDLSRMNSFLSICAFVKSYDDKKDVNKLIDKNTWVLNRMITEILEQPLDSILFKEEQFNNSIQLLLAISPQTDFRYIIKKLSPIENNSEAIKKFNKFYPHDKNNKPYDGYHLLACLYAAGNGLNTTSEIYQCIDSVISNYNNYPSEVEFSFFDIVSTLSRYNNYKKENIEPLFSKFSKENFINSFSLLNTTVANTFNKQIPFGKLNGTIPNNYYVKYFCSKAQDDKVWDFYAAFLDNNTDKLFVGSDAYRTESKWKEGFNKDDFNFYSAMFYKKRGTYCLEVYNETNESGKYFEKAIELYNLLPEEYLSSTGQVKGSNMDNWDLSSFKRRLIFLYPKLLNEFFYARKENGGMTTSWRPFSRIPEQSQTPGFLNYILKNNLTKYYNNKEGVAILQTYYSNIQFNSDFKKDSTLYACIDLMKDLIEKNNSLIENINYNFVSLVLVNRAFEELDTTLAFNRYSNLDFKAILKSDIFFGNGDGIPKSIARHFAKNGHVSESFKLINAFKVPEVRRNLLTDIAYDLQETGPVENTFIYLDSIFKNNDVDGKPKFGNKLICVLGMVGSQRMYDLAMNLIKEIPEMIKPNAIGNLVKGVAYNNNLYYKAMNYIPASVSSNKELQLYDEILQTEVKKRLKNTSAMGWKNYDENKESAPGDYEDAYGNIKFDNLD